MVEFRVEHTGYAAAAARLRALAVALPAATKTATGLAAHAAEAAIKAQLTQSSHKRGPTPSRPGSPPSLVSGTLMRSIAVQGPTTTGATAQAGVGPTAVYGRIHEIGGQAGRGHATTLPPRPYLRPGVEAAHARIRDIYYAAWRGVLHG